MTNRTLYEEEKKSGHGRCVSLFPDHSSELYVVIISRLWVSAHFDDHRTTEVIVVSPFPAFVFSIFMCECMLPFAPFTDRCFPHRPIFMAFEALLRSMFQTYECKAAKFNAHLGVNISLSLEIFFSHH